MTSTMESNPEPRQQYMAVIREPAATEFDLRRVVSVVKRWRTPALIAFGLCLAVSVLYAILSPQVYRAQIVGVPVTENSRLGAGISLGGGALGGLASLAGIRVGGDIGKRAEILTILRSQEFLEDFIVDNNLLPKLFPDKWDAKAARWRSDLDEVPTPTDGFVKFSESVLRIAEDQETGLVTIATESVDREAVAAWTTGLIARLNALTKEQAIKEADASLAFLEQTLNTTERLETREAVYQLIEAQLNKAMLAKTSEEFALRTIERAVVPAEDRFVRPKRAFVVFAGFIAGLLMALFVTFVLDALWPRGTSRDGNGQ